MAAAKQSYTVVGVFEDRTAADRAIADLRQGGFRQDQIGVALRDAEGAVATDSNDSYSLEGASTGILAGLGLGALAGLGVLAGVIPVVGTAIAGGTLGIILSNAAAGAAVVGLVGALIGAGIPEDEAAYYQSEFEAGRTIVTVTADGRADEARTILRRHGAYDMSTRGATVSATATNVTSDRAMTREGGTIQVKEERLHAHTHPVQTGEVQVRKEVHTETKHLEVPVEREEVVIERTPMHGRASSSQIRDGEVIRIPVSEEEVRVTKDAVVTEEVKVGKRVVHDTEKVAGQVRTEEVKVEQKGDVNVRSNSRNR
jgi:uncharacterized protein (TIGR02271 family)